MSPEQLRAHLIRDLGVEPARMAVVPDHQLEAFLDFVVTEGEPPYQHAEGMAQVLILDTMFPAFVEWLRTRDLHLFRIPKEEDDADDFVTYGVGISERLWRGESVNEWPLNPAQQATFDATDCTCGHAPRHSTSCAKWRVLAAQNIVSPSGDTP